MVENCNLRPDTLVHGAELILAWTRRCGSYFGFLVCLSRSGPASVAGWLLLVSTVAIYALYLSADRWRLHTQFATAAAATAAAASSQLSNSAFVLSCVWMLEMGVILSHMLLVSLLVRERPRLVALTLSRAYLVHRRSQRLYALSSVAVMAYRVLSVLSTTVCVNHAIGCHWLLNLYITFMVALYLVSHMGPVAFLCYLSQALGEHVRQFTAIHVDSLFPGRQQRPASLQPLLCSSKKQLKSYFALLLELLARRRYTQSRHSQLRLQASSLATSAGQQTAACRLAQARNTVRRAQASVGRLVEASCHLSRLLPFFVLMESIALLFACFIIIFTYEARRQSASTALCHCCALLVSSSCLFTWHVCCSMDELALRLKLMNNRIFDFIILNTNHSKLPQARPDHAAQLDELWAQFRILRKMCDCARFKVGGVLPVSRRLILSIMGHNLSFLFLCFEVKHVIDRPGALAPSTQAAAAADAARLTLSPT